KASGQKIRSLRRQSVGWRQMPGGIADRPRTIFAPGFDSEAVGRAGDAEVKSHGRLQLRDEIDHSLGCSAPLRRQNGRFKVKAGPALAGFTCHLRHKLRCCIFRHTRKWAKASEKD